MNSSKKNSLKINSIFSSFFHSQSTGGVILLICAVVALIIANTPSMQSLQELWSVKAGITVGTFNLQLTILDWVNDGLMAIFFFVVGLEIKREMLVGELSSPKQAALPIVAALGGMVVPAAIYTLFNYGTDTQNGWGIPMATDIAFAIGVISIMGKRCPLALKVFLTALAIVDDLGAIVVLAIFYPSHELHVIYLLIALLIFVGLLIMNKAKIHSPLAYLIPGLFLWYFVFQSGVHATIAGVLLAAAIPSKTSINEVRFYVRTKFELDRFKASGNSELDVIANKEQQDAIHKMNTMVDSINPLMSRFETVLHPWVNFCIMPLFALANAGVVFDGNVLNSDHIPTLAAGIFAGLLLGKPLGIFLFSWLSVKLKIAELPVGVKWSQMAALGVVAGIGFTMSIFIDNLAFSNLEYINIGKATILVTSFLAAILGTFVMYLTSDKVKDTKQRKKR